MFPEYKEIMVRKFCRTIFCLELCSPCQEYLTVNSEENFVSGVIIGELHQQKPKNPRVLFELLLLKNSMANLLRYVVFKEN